MPRTLTAVDPAQLRATAGYALEDIDDDVKTDVNDIVAQNEEDAKLLTRIQFGSVKELDEWKGQAYAYAAHMGVRLRGSGVKGKADTELYIRGFKIPQE